MTLLTYSILNYEDIKNDITLRTKILTDFKTLIDRRIKIQSEYLGKMRELGQMAQMKKIPNATKATEFIYNSLVNAFHKEIENIANHTNRMDHDICKIMSSGFGQLDAEGKKELNSFSAIIRDYDKSHEDIQKLKIKMIKKAYQLKKLKEEYIVGTLIDMPFDKKNKLFIKAKQIQDVYGPLRAELEVNAKNFNIKATTSANKLKQIIQKLKETQNKKVEVMKNVFMVLQISNSQFGANLIQEKADILSKINQLESNPELIQCSEQDFQVNKNYLHIHCQDPCFYINKLFTNIVDTKNFQSLVMYGQQEQHKLSISESMSLADSNVTRLNEDNQGYHAVKLVAQAFKSIFDEGMEIDPVRILKLKQLMKESAENRKNFILCLQGFRKQSIFYLPERKLNQITMTLNYLLDHCLLNADTYNSKLLLVLSLTYKVKVGQETLDLHTYIKDHQIWKQKQWWQSALLESSYEEIKIKPSKKMMDVPITIWHIKGAGLKQPEGENELTTHQILFNQLHFYVFNMRLFEVKQEFRTYIGRKYFKYFLLNNKRWCDIEEMLQNLQTSTEDLEAEYLQQGGSPMFSNKKRPSRKFY